MAETFKMRRGALREIRRSREVLAALEDEAEDIASAAGEGMEVFSEIGPNRARASVVTTTFEAMHAEATGRLLTRALGSR